MKNLPKIVLGLGGVLVLVLVFMVWQKSQVKPVENPVPAPVAEVKKVDLSTQPDWVQKLEVTAKKGQSANSLENVTVTVKGLPKGMVDSVNYVIQYQTSNKGAQGALSSKPVDVSGATTFTKTIDLGTCSTKSCVRHDGVTTVDLELDFLTSDGSSPVWSKTLDLK